MSESGIVWWLGQHLLITTALAALVFLICRAVRLNPAARHVLWLLVLCRLLVPPMATWPWSIPIAANDAPDTLRVQPVVENSVDAVLDAIPALDEFQFVSGYDAVEILPPASGRNADTAPIVESEDAGQTEASRRFRMAWVIAGLWPVGSLITAMVLIRRIRRVSKRLKKESNIDPWLQNEIADWCARLAVRTPDCVVTSKTRSPFLWCLGCVRLIWPLFASYSKQREQARPILIHELAHLKRRDHWTAWIELFALILWWWNPVLWFVRRQLRISAEMACDAWVVKLLPDQRRAYAESLVEFNSRGQASQLAFGSIGANTGSRRTFEKRLEMIMKEDLATQLSKWIVLMAVLLGMLSLPVFSMAPAAQPEDSSAQSQAIASNDQVFAEPIAQFNQQIDEPQTAKVAVVARSTGEIDRDNSVTTPSVVESGYASQLQQEDSVSKLESSSIPGDFIIGLEDILKIHVWGEPELTVEEVMVRPDGKISLPPVGDIQASGLTPMLLKEHIEERLEAFVSSPLVTVVVLQVGSRYDKQSGQLHSTIREDFIIGSEDSLRIDVWRKPELSMEEVLVRPDGKISLPPVGDIQASGLTPMLLKEHIEERLEAFVSSPLVTVVVLQVGGRHDTQSGQVQNPGLNNRTVARASATLSDALSQIEQQYYRRIDRSELEHVALEAIMSKLDDRSSLLTPEEFEQMTASVADGFAGIGIAIGLDSETGRPIVKRLFRNSAAQAAGLRRDDIILSIDEESTEGLGLEDLVTRVRGPRGSTVTLGIQRAEEELAVKIVREQIEIPSISPWSWSADGRENYWADHSSRIGYVHIPAFTNNTVSQLRKALAHLSAEGMKGLVLDLRDCNGGLLRTAIEVVDMFIDEGVILLSQGRSEDKNTTFLAKPGGEYTDLPLAVLMNGNTASAAEIVAASLQDHHRAAMVGEQTSGRGSVQSIFLLEDGGALKLTTATWLRPNGRTLLRQEGSNIWGVQPDAGLAVPLAEEIRKQLADLRESRLNGEEVNTPINDPQMNRAVAFLQHE